MIHHGIINKPVQLYCITEHIFSFRFELLLSDEVLLNCFDSEFEKSLGCSKSVCYMEALSLCTALTRSQYLLNLICAHKGEFIFVM